MSAKHLKCLVLWACVLVAVEGMKGGRGGSGTGFKSSFKSLRPRGFLGQPGATSSRQTAPSNGDKSWTWRGGLGAWGIISLVMSVIVGSILAYYVSIFYPIICAERGKYDVMEMTPV